MILGGRQVLPVAKDTLPQVAEAITAAIRAEARMAVIEVNHRRLVRFFGPTMDVYIDGSDWDKVLAGLAQDPLVTFSEGSTSLATHSAIDRNYTRQYRKVYDTISLLFTNAYPNPGY